MYKKVKTDNSIIDIVPYEDIDRFGDDGYNTVGICKDGYVLPYRRNGDTRVGVYKTKLFGILKEPKTEEEKNIYRISESNTVDFNNTENIRDVIKAQEKLMSLESSLLTTVDNISIPEINQNDSPEMKALKQSIIFKKIDLDKYGSKMGPNYQNNKRLLKKNDITSAKLKEFANTLDIKISLVLEDMDDSVINPIGRKIKVALNGPESTDPPKIYGIYDNEIEEEGDY